MTKELETICPYCSKINELHEQRDASGEPAPGDISMCISCGNFAMFGDDMSLHKLTDAQKNDLRHNREAYRELGKLKLAWLMTQIVLKKQARH